MLGATSNYNFNKDYELQNPPNDGISWLTWSTKANHLAVSSWDQSVRVYDVGHQSGTIQRANGIALSQNEAPVLCSSWSGDGKILFSGLSDGKLKVWPVATGGQATTLGSHASGIKSVQWIEEIQSVVTGSWDKTLKYWDGRSANPTAVIQLPERCYALDVQFPLAVVATADRHIVIYDLNKATVEYKRIASPLKYQSRCVTAFADKTGFAVGSIEGRVGIHHVEDKDQPKNFAFKCHRDGNDIYAVNHICFHPQFGTFATTGSDGTFNFWDKENKQRLKAFSKAPTSIPCGSFSTDGALFAYAVSYDWSKGSEYYNPQTSKNYAFLHVIQEAEIKARPGAKTGKK